jgi:hypothetical protein
MSSEDQPPDEIYVPEQPRTPGQSRGYFFYIAVFFILIALLCYLLNSSNVISLESGFTPPAPPASPSAK